MNGLPPEDQPPPGATAGGVYLAAACPIAMATEVQSDGSLMVHMRGNGALRHHAAVEILRDLADLIQRAALNDGGPHGRFGGATIQIPMSQGPG